MEKIVLAITDWDAVVELDPIDWGLLSYSSNVITVKDPHARDVGMRMVRDEIKAVIRNIQPRLNVGQMYRPWGHFYGVVTPGFYTFRDGRVLNSVQDLKAIFNSLENNGK